MTLFDNIKKITKERGYSIAEVERKAGISTNYMYQWKTRNPSPKSLEAVAKVLNVSVDELLSKESIANRDLEVEEAIDSMRSYQGNPITESQREILRGIIKGYLDSKDK